MEDKGHVLPLIMKSKSFRCWKGGSLTLVASKVIQLLVVRAVAKKTRSLGAGMETWPVLAASFGASVPAMQACWQDIWFAKLLRFPCSE